jgi:acyl carrier protein
MPPLRGVIHAAMEIDDALIGELDAGQLERALAPKLGGALHLDRLTRSDPIEIFLLYSSATSVLGAPGQGAYVAANLALEAVARRRHALGLPALAVAWGPIGDSGYLARNEKLRDGLLRRFSADALKTGDALDALPRLAALGQPVVAFASLRWDGIKRALPILASPTFAAFAGSETGNSDDNLRDRLAGLSPDACRDAILAVLREELGRILGALAADLDVQRSVAALGMDSLMAVELRLAVEARLGVQLPLLSLSDETSLAVIADRITRSVMAPTALPRDIATTAQLYESADPEAIRASAAGIAASSAREATAP